MKANAMGGKPLSVTVEQSQKVKRGGDASAQGDLVTRLRSDIVNGDFSPLERLKFADLGKRYDVGFGTLREALSQLATEGYVTQETNKGFAVAPVSVVELEEVTELYIEFEQRALVDAITHGDDAWEAQIVADHHRLFAIERLDWEDRVARHQEWVLRHREFHASLVAACKNIWLLRLRDQMFDQLDRYRFVTKMASTGRRTSPRTEHRKIMEAVLARDTEAAQALIDTHIRKTAQSAVKLL